MWARSGLDGAFRPRRASEHRDARRGSRTPSAATSRSSTVGQHPDELVALGGVVTNLAAVMHALASYDPDVVQGTTLNQTEIDRQIELYRGRTADERRGTRPFSLGEPRSCSPVPASFGRRWRSSAATRLSSATEGSGTACCSNASTIPQLVRPTPRQDDSVRHGAGNPARRRATRLHHDHGVEGGGHRPAGHCLARARARDR